MTPDIILVLVILLVALILFITEWIAMDVVALIVLITLALTGLVSPTDVFSGFSNPAVITVWAMFILSEALTRAGIAQLIGHHVLKLAGHGEARMIAVIMLTSGGLSAFMNNIGVAALMLPVVMDIAKRTNRSPSRLLMPLAYGSLLGGLTTLFGTPPNLLVSNALKENGLAPFQIFDFTPVGLSVMLTGIAFVALVGRHLLPEKVASQNLNYQSKQNLAAQYALQERTYVLKLPSQSILAGKTLANAQLNTTAGLAVLGLIRHNTTQLLPPSSAVLENDDRLLVQGRLERFNELKYWSQLSIERETSTLSTLVSDKISIAEATIANDSILINQGLEHSYIRSEYGINVLAIKRDAVVRRSQLSQMPLVAGDKLLVQGDQEGLAKLTKSPEYSSVNIIDQADIEKDYQLQEHIFIVRVPQQSDIIGETLEASRIGDAFDFRILAVFRDSELKLMPTSDFALEAKDLLLVQGQAEHLDVLRGLQQLEVEKENTPDLGILDSDKVTLLEAMLSPRSQLAGKHVVDIQFEKKYGLRLLAIWRKEHSFRSNLDNIELHHGDAFLLLGPREKLLMLNQDNNFLTLTQVKRNKTNPAKAWIASLIMVGVIVPVLGGFLPISVSAVVGATLMVVAGTLTMEEAYRAIEWKAVFLIAGMIPLGIAMQDTGAAQFLAESLINQMADLGPWPVIIALYLLTAMATMIVPTAALVLLMAPIVLHTSTTMGLSPHALMMTVAIAASASFTSPISHPANILVMGPGGYRFKDYLKLGIPLTLVVMIVALVILPIFWPLVL